jgi:hypothetical protein
METQDPKDRFLHACFYDDWELLVKGKDKLDEEEEFKYPVYFSRTREAGDLRDLKNHEDFWFDYYELSDDEDKLDEEVEFKYPYIPPALPFCGRRGTWRSLEVAGGATKSGPLVRTNLALNQ